MKGKLDSCKKMHVYFRVGFWSSLEISAEKSNVVLKRAAESSVKWKRKLNIVKIQAIFQSGPYNRKAM